MANPDFILLGDSHAGAIGTAARAAGLDFVGGPLASGRDFYLPFCDQSQGAIQFLNDDMQELHQQLCEMIKVDNLLSSDLPILCTIGSGFHVAATTALWGAFVNPEGEVDKGFLQSALFNDICATLFDPALQFYNLLRDAGCSVAFALPPQRCPETSDLRIMQAFQTQALMHLHEFGLSIIDTRAVTSHDGLQRDEFCKANDPVHGNQAFGAVVLEHAGYLRDGVARHK